MRTAVDITQDTPKQSPTTTTDLESHDNQAPPVSTLRAAAPLSRAEVAMLELGEHSRVQNEQHRAARFDSAEMSAVQHLPEPDKQKLSLVSRVRRDVQNQLYLFVIAQVASASDVDKDDLALFIVQELRPLYARWFSCFCPDDEDVKDKLTLDHNPRNSTKKSFRKKYDGVPEKVLQSMLEKVDYSGTVGDYMTYLRLKYKTKAMVESPRQESPAETSGFGKAFQSGIMPAAGYEIEPAVAHRQAS